MHEAGSGPRMRYAYSGLIVAAAIACFSNSLAGPFVFDDQTAIVANPGIRTLAGMLTQDRNRPTSGRRA